MKQAVYKKATMISQETRILIKLIGIAAISMAIATSCSKSNSNGGNQTTNVVPPVIIDPTVPDGGGGSGTTYSTGSTVAFKPVSLSMMNEYVATRPLNYPTNFQINVNLSTPGAGVYGGEVSLSYMDNGIPYNGVFKSGLGKNATHGYAVDGTWRPFRYDSGRWESEFNYWFKYNNKTVFTGMFEDEYGAIAIVIEPTGTTQNGGNDAEPIVQGPYKGSIYFKNFVDAQGRPVGSAHPPGRHCWFTYTGVYDCRSNVVMTKCHQNPGADSGYRLLGTFEGLDVKKAFNIN